MMTVTTAESKALMVPRYRVAVNNAEIIQREVARYREQLTTQGLLRNSIIAVAMLLLLAFLLKALGWLYRFLDRRTETLRNAVIQPIVFRGNIVVSRSQIEQAITWFFKLLRIAVSLILVYSFLTTVFGLFPWTQAWSERLLSYAVAPLEAFGNMVVNGAPNLLAIAVIVVIVRWMIRVSNYFFR